MVFSINGALLSWRWPEPVNPALPPVMGILGATTQAFYIRGMAAGDAAAMAPVDYIRLVFATAVGFFPFAEAPTVWTILGAAVVVASTPIITWREHAASRRGAVGAEPV